MYGILSLKKRGERGMTMAQMTKMQQRIYDYIAETIQRQGYPPSVREIGEAVGLKSPSTVHFHLKSKAKSLDAKLAKGTKWVGAAFIVLTLVINCMLAAGMNA